MRLIEIQIHGAACRCRETGRGDSWRMLSGREPRPQGRDGKTSDTPDSDGLLHTGVVRSGCRSSIRRSACESSLLINRRAPRMTVKRRHVLTQASGIEEAIYAA